MISAIECVQNSILSIENKEVFGGGGAIVFKII